MNHLEFLFKFDDELRKELKEIEEEKYRKAKEIFNIKEK
jgi:hypothetical protein